LFRSSRPICPARREIERVANEAGPLDIVVNNAGAIPPGDLYAVDDAHWRSAWGLEVFGALYPRLKERRGVIINVIGAAGSGRFPVTSQGARATQP
jgi:NAD(P)-dependent dehydrogenase (short-subunit alcohol dehydrogenase family)